MALRNLVDGERGLGCWSSSVESTVRMTSLVDELELEEERGRSLAALLAESHHGALPIRESFLQIRGTPPEPGPLSELVGGRHHHALDLYLLILAAAAR